MTAIMSGGLVPAGRRIDVPANDNRRVPTAPPATGKQDANDNGWDPFEVWRTRIKEVRDRNAALIPDIRSES